MGQITLTISYKKNSNQAISAAEFKALYLKNIALTTSSGVLTVDDDTIDQFLKEAQDQIENTLNVSMSRSAYQENRDFVHDDWIQWGYFPVTYPVVDAYSVKGFFNSTMQIEYPKVWLSSKKQTGGAGANDENFQRTINLVPVQGSATTLAGSGVALTPYIGYFGNRTIPNYWQLTYITGFNIVPPSVFRALGLQAAIQVLTLASANLNGGLASKSIGIDGLSQSVTTTASSSKIAYGALIDTYQKQLDGLLDSLVSNYVGFTFGAL